jgi:hypothetical protein
MTLARRARRRQSRLPYAAANPRRRMRSGSITTVTRISGAGIVPKHANVNVSHTTLFWETSMILGTKFFAVRSELGRVQRSAASDQEALPSCRIQVLRPPARGGGSRQAPDDGPFELASSGAAPRRRSILAAGFDVVSTAASRCVFFADLLFTNFPVAVVSWLVTQFFLGCAAYAEAMYPSAGHVSGNDALRRCNPTGIQPGEGDRVGVSPKIVPDLRELSGHTIDVEAREQRSPAIQTGMVTGGIGETGNIVWLNATRKTPSRRLASTAQLVSTWLSGRRRSVPDRQVTVEIRNYERRPRQGAAMPRYGTD